MPITRSRKNNVALGVFALAAVETNVVLDAIVAWLLDGVGSWRKCIQYGNFARFQIPAHVDRQTSLPNGLNDELVAFGIGDCDPVVLSVCFADEGDFPIAHIFDMEHGTIVAVYRNAGAK